MVVILGSLALIFLIDLLIVFRDLRLIRSNVSCAISELGTVGFSRAVSRKLLIKLWSEEGRRINELFQLILRNFREAKVELSVERELELQNKCIQLDNITSTLTEHSESSLYSQVLSLAKNKTHATVAAVAYLKDEKVHLILSAHEGKKFKEALEYSLKSYFETASKAAIGVKDLSVNEGVLGSLSSFGLRYAVVYPFGEQSESQAPRGLIWAAYSETILPRHTDVRLLRDLAQRLDTTLVTRDQISSVYQDLKKIEDVSKARDQFIAGMSHDIKTPLHNLRNILLLVQSEMQALGDLPELLKLALRNCGSAQEMIEDILYFSRYQLGRLETKRVCFDAVNEVRNIVESFGASAKKKNLCLNFSTTEETLGIVWDRKHLERVVANLIGNSIKYTEFGEIAVKVSCPHPGKVAISVLDSGPGISAENLAVVFEPYRRCSTDDSEGLGLGLAITKILTEANDAVINVSSEIRRGSVFEIVTPRVLLGENNTSQQSSTVVEINREKRTVTVMLVDDDVDCVNSLARALLAAGFQVLKAYSTTEALGLLQFESPQLVISDAKMPHGGLKRIVAACNATRVRPGIIVLSGLDSTEDRAEFTRLGVDQILVKPAPIEAVILALDEVAKKINERLVEALQVA